jgi:hypothetical protein
MIRLRWLVILAVSATPAAGAPTAPAEPKDAPATRPAGAAVELDKRYMDPIHGFSLRPPLGTERTRESGATVLVKWSRRDEKTLALVWTLAAQKATEAKKEIDPNAYAEALVKNLAAKSDFKADSVKHGKMGEAPTIDLTGTIGGVARLWQRQTWALGKDGDITILSITGPQDMKDQLNGIYDTVMGTLELNDPKKALDERKENVARGTEFLKNLKDARVAAALSGDPQWFLLRLKGEDMGFVAQKEFTTPVDRVDGSAVQSWVWMQLPGDKPRMLLRKMFLTPDRSFERWAEDLRIGADKDSVRILEDGLKQDDMIVCTVTVGPANPQRLKKQAPQDFYLPRVVHALLPRLVDLTKPAAYTFASYNSQLNTFDMRTFTVIGPQKITVNQSQVEAIKVTDQGAADTEPAVLWVNAKGLVLRMSTSDGLLMEAVPKTVIIQRFPKADDVAKEIGK